MELVLLLCILLLLVSAPTADSNGWLSHGGDILNRRYADEESKISPETVSNLRLKWKFNAGRDITATPSVLDGAIYFPSWDGYLYAVNESDGSLIWKQNLQQLTGFNSTGLISNVSVIVSRTTPAIADDLVIVGICGPASVVAVKRSSGELVWSTLLDGNPAGCITMSGTYYKGNFYVGTSSLEEVLSLDKCCTFRGSFVKLDGKTGKILWQTFMLPENFGNRGEYAGAAIWGSSPPIDTKRSLVYIATGNLYSVPQNISDCQERENNQTQIPPTHSDECIEPDNHSESFVALDLDTGNIKWFHQLGGYDVWFFACSNLSVPDCPPGPNPDADFGEAPMMITIDVNGTEKDIVVAVQKSGFAWALDRDDGNIIWFTEAGPGGVAGGGTWGAATDEKRVYTNIANSDRKNFTLKPSTRNAAAGGWVAMDSKNGEILWSTGDPSNGTVTGPVTVANGVLFGGSTHKEGPIYAMDGKSGEILWSYNTGATVFGGMSVSDGCVFVGHGYRVGFGTLNPNNTAGNSLFAFCIS
ncbi:polyvinylalcohol dehydrogenase-like [Hibiscus syriacus]|uniref:polyvinylalcohol dehydrogenase-like n=1 Tax=Hibiscus syriacus TaxID=106335 RepID=UPI0019234180|nr:polyvinylalcohol dehydrogenase-like [Hibiscus syriacus]